MKQPARGRAPKKHVILFLAANPLDTDRVTLDREARAIQLELKRSGYRDRFEFVTWGAAEPLDLLRMLRERTPTVVHFSGHGARPAKATSRKPSRDVVADVAPDASAPGGVVFVGLDGQGQVVTPAAFGQTLAAAGVQVRLVVLNACFTAPMAQDLAAHVDCVVGMTGAIHDDAARIFSIGFYGGLGEQASVAVAFAHGRAAINLEGLADVDQPQLVVRDGFDATGLILAAVEPSVLVDLPCPYPGMRPFTADDTERFHGREREITELISQLRAGEREIFVIGPSGSGKSSLVTAGVLPQLARGVAGLGPCVVRQLRPGEQPAARLGEALEVPDRGALAVSERVAALLGHHAAGTLLLVVVDQLEELFTLASTGERAVFLEGLRALRAERRCAVVFTLRADFFGALMESDLWAERRGKLSRIEVSPLRGEVLCEAIVAPASAVAVTIDPELIVRLVGDAASEPGILPLLQETMVQLWDKRSDQTLTLADYQALGDGKRSGLSVALARRAKITLGRFDVVETAIARRILLRLISFGEGRSDTRRQQSRAQLCSAADDAVAFSFVLQAMVEDRLLTVDDDVTGEPRVDLSHEALITAWPELQTWIDERRADGQRRRRLEAHVAEWIERGQATSRLLDAVELAEVEKWHASDAARELGQPAELADLVAASQRAIDERARQRRQRTRRTVTALAVGLVVVSTLGVVAWVQRQEARENSAEVRRQAREVHRKLASNYQEQGRALLIDQSPSQPIRALPYLVAAREELQQVGDDIDPVLRMLYARAVNRGPSARLEGVISAAFSPDGARVVTANKDGTARVWDADTGQPLTNLLAPKARGYERTINDDGELVVTASHDDDRVEAAAFSPDGARVVTASHDGIVQVWGAHTGQLLTEPLAQSPGEALFSGSVLAVAAIRTGQPLTTESFAHQGHVVAAAFNPDGVRMVFTSERIARVWDVHDEPLTGPFAHQGQFVAAAFSPDGARVVTASDDGTARVWDAHTAQPLTGSLAHRGKVTAVSFSPDGARVVTASDDGTARVWDARTGKPLTEPLEHRGKVTAAAFSSDGARVVTASDDGTAQVWNVRTDQPLTVSLAHHDKITAVSFSPDGARVAIASDDGTARVWDVNTGTPIIQPLAHHGAVTAVSFSPDDARVATASNDGAARVWDAHTGQPLPLLFLHDGKVTAVSFSADGARVVTASDDGTARVWDVNTGTPITQPLAHHGPVYTASFSADGARVVTASDDGTARVWDAHTGTPITQPLAHHGAVTAAAFSPDGALVVTASWDHSARVWDARTGKLLTEPSLEHRGKVTAAAFSPDGARVITASEEGIARVWDARTGKPLTEPLVHQGSVNAAAFSPDGTRVVTASDDGTARVWEVRTGKPITEPLKHRGKVTAAVFSSDGARVVTASSDSTARIWELPLDPGSLDDWKRRVRCGVFALENGILVDQHGPCP